MSMAKVVSNFLFVTLVALPWMAEAAMPGLRINDAVIPAQSLQFLQHSSALGAVDEKTLSDSVIDNRLIAHWAESRLTAHALAHLDMEVENAVHEVLLAQLPTIEKPVTTVRAISAAELRQLLKTDLDKAFTLTAAQQQAVAKRVLVSIDEPESTAVQVSLLDVYTRETIQGLAELHVGNHRYLLERAQQIAERRWQQQQWQQRGMLSAEVLQGLQRLMRDHQLKQRWLLEQGLTGDPHHESEVAEQRWRQVSKAQIEQFYQQNRDQFRQVERVSGGYFMLSSQQQADALFQQVQNGAGLDQLVQQQKLQRYTLEVSNDAGQKSLLQKLALIQKPGISRPFRAEQAWVMFDIKTREDRVLPLSDASVQHSCARAIALQQAQQEFEALRMRLRTEASISELHAGEGR